MASEKWSDMRIALALFALLALALYILTRHVVAMAIFDAADFAANSLLIQEAKRLTLLTGNYSRVDFHHPGPALLYMLAAGEVLFHDWLKLTSPIGGQLVATLIYSAAWLAALWFVMVRLLADRVAGSLAALAFFAFCIWHDQEIFVCPFFPYLYCLPFAVFTASLALAVARNGEGLWIAAVACGFLINGHSAFFLVCGIMLLCLMPLVRTTWRNRVAAGLVGSVFLIPLLILTVTNWTGPIGDYLAFAGKVPTNNVIESVSFTFSVFGGIILAFIGAGALAWLLAGAELEQEAVALLAALAAATLATLVYSIKGLDSFQPYLIEYFNTIPALAVGAAVAALFLTVGRPEIFALIAIVILLPFDAYMASRVPLRIGFYMDPNVVRIANTLESLGPAVVLEMDQSRDWHFLWAITIGAQSYALRRAPLTYCIGEGWNISHSRAARCTAEQLATRPHFVVRWTRAFPELKGTAVVDDTVVAVFRQ